MDDAKITPAWHILPIIVFAQFAGGSIWFASNAVLQDLTSALDLPSSSLGILTAAVQLGFVSGTLLFAFFAVADRVSPSLLFLICSLGGSCFNAAILCWGRDLLSFSVQRFCVGMMLAGIYPVGMKIAADWYARELGRALGYLVGALVLGTALPHMLRGIEQVFAWQSVIGCVSVMAAFGGGVLYFFVRDGPYRKAKAPFQPQVLLRMFANQDFRAATLGYFGHMWELYAFWAFVPVLLGAYAIANPGVTLNISLWSAAIIGIGCLGCVLGGIWSGRLGSARIAFIQLSISGFFCLTSPILILAPLWLFLSCLLLWGIVVVGDSPQYSTLSARTAPKEYVGSALTIMNCIGFSITVCSIFLLGWLRPQLPMQYLPLMLLPGPVLGLIALKPLVQRKM